MELCLRRSWWWRKQLLPEKRWSPAMSLHYRHSRLHNLSFLSSAVRPMATETLFHSTAFSQDLQVFHHKAHLENPPEDMQLKILRQKLEELRIDSKTCTPGQNNYLICPMCEGGDKAKWSLSLFITQDGGAALWTCFCAKCGWKGSTKLRYFSLLKYLMFPLTHWLMRESASFSSFYVGFY